MASLAIYLLVHHRDYDIVHVHQALYPAFISVLFGKGLLHKPVLVKSASSGLTSDIKLLRGFPLGQLQLKYLLNKMDCLVSVSGAGANEFTEIGFPESQIIRIPNGVSILPEGKATYGKVINVLTTTRLSREKGIDVLLRAWANIIKQYKNLKLSMLGSGPLGEELEGLSKSLGITGSVDFTGGVNHVLKYLRDADLFVLPSRSEGLSNALLEAMSYGVPCVATNVGGNAEALGMDEYKKIPSKEYLIAKNGLLVNPDDVEGLSKAMLHLIRDEKAREEMGRKSRVFIEEHYSIDLVADRYITLYRRMLDGRS